MSDLHNDFFSVSRVRISPSSIFLLPMNFQLSVCELPALVSEHCNLDIYSYEILCSRWIESSLCRHSKFNASVKKYVVIVTVQWMFIRPACLVHIDFWKWKNWWVLLVRDNGKKCHLGSWMNWPIFMVFPGWLKKGDICRRQTSS